MWNTNYYVRIFLYNPCLYLKSPFPSVNNIFFFKSFLTAPFFIKFLPNFLPHHYHPIFTCFLFHYLNIILRRGFRFNSTQSTRLFSLFFAISIFLPTLIYLNLLFWPVLLNITVFRYFTTVIYRRNTYLYMYFSYRIQILYLNFCILYILFCSTSQCLYPISFLMSVSSHLFWNFDWITVDPYIIFSYFLNFLSYTFVSIPVYTSFVTKITMHDVLLV